MKQLFLSFLLCFLVLMIITCQQKNEDIIKQTFPDDQKEIEEIINKIFETGKTKILPDEFSSLDDALNTLHLFGPKFTAFKYGMPRANSEQTFAEEKTGFLDTTSSVLKYDLNDMKVNVFGKVAIATFHAYFELMIKDQTTHMNLQSTLIFVEDNENWRIVHEHFSPLNPSE